MMVPAFNFFFFVPVDSTRKAAIGCIGGGVLLLEDGIPDCSNF